MTQELTNKAIATDILKLGSEQQFGLEEKLGKDKKLTIKLGFDPTSPDLHLGHYIVLRGAKKFQEMGHNVTIIVGDFTASIGDPSGRNKLRPPLTSEDITENAKTYMDQVFMVLDKDKTKVVQNSNWLGKMDVKDMLAILSSVTLSQMLVRDDFRNRFDAQTPIFMHEMAYPLMQGLDSVAIKADVELGGTDQTFNLMMGRQMQKDRKMEEQAVVTFPLLVGLDGVKKMSKSLGNQIGLRDSPTDQFGKIMSVSDNTMWNYWQVLGEKTLEQVETMKASGVNPRDLKLDLGMLVVSLFHGSEVAAQQKQNFLDKFTNKKIIDVEEVEVQIEGDDIGIAKLIKDLDMATSISDAGRKMEQNGVKINQEIVNDKREKLSKNSDVLLQVGKLHMKKVKIR
jgi:tyrosyl-tRNA synthetase